MLAKLARQLIQTLGTPTIHILMEGIATNIVFRRALHFNWCVRTEAAWLATRQYSGGW